MRTPPTQNSTLSDAELVQAARRGDKWAFVEIVARHQAMVCGIALGILGDFSSSEDAGQEAFLTAWRKIYELREPDRLKAWLAQIARNAALGQVRRHRGHDLLEDDPIIPDNAPQPDQAAATHEEAALVRQELAALPELYRLPLVLFYREGQSVRAVAEALGISEDAVKQRLARGREMLREQMARKIESALIRTAPTAIFTMTLAAAIGALATPSAIAGTVFAAASASSASTGASSSTTLLTLMSTSKAFLVTTALVATLCIPVGYRMAARASLPPAAVIRAPIALQAETARPISFSESALFAEWRALHERYGTNAQSMPRLYEAIAGIKDRFRRQAFRAALISEWVQVDAAGRLPFFLAKGRDETQRREFFEEWLARAPRAAVDGGLAGGQGGWDTMARECLTQIARAAPERVPEIASRLPKPENYWDRQAVQDAFAILGERDLTSARQAAEGVTGDNQNQALEGVAQSWAKSDFDAVLKWARSLPANADRDEIIRAALVGKATVDPAAALDSVGLVPTGGRYAHFGTTTGARVLAEAGSTDFDLTASWMAAHPGGLGRDDVEGLARTVTDRLNADPAAFLAARVADGSLEAILPAINSALLNNGGGQRAAVWEWLKSQPETQTTQDLQLEVLRSAAFEDPSLALRLVSDLPNTPEGDKQLQELARSLFNGGNALSRFDALYQQSPDRLRQPLVDAAFQSLSGSSLDDPQKWLSRLSLLPEASRPNATELLARAWGQQTPEEALSWAATLPAGDLQNGAMAAVTAGWATKDAQGAAEWLASLPAGTQRDRDAEALASAVARDFPREAWTWVTSISDDSIRLRAATDTLNLMASRDPVSARQWIDSAPFTAENKAQLQAIVNRGSGSPGGH
jgi:RNA polymerase sigma factor (sigma-70 family)